jgi:hypothetical protein
MRYKSFIPSGIIPDRVKTNDMEKKQTAVQWLVNEYAKAFKIPINSVMLEIIEQALQMEREQIEKFNDFLEKEKQLEISDLKTIERIQWYYNTYFNETFGGQDE